MIYERARFNSRVQKDGESIETFLTDLYALIENCEYENFKEPLLRDRIVVGIRDKKLSEQLQLDDKLTLQTALAKVRSKEMITKQSNSLQQLNTSRADAVKHSTNQASNKPQRNAKKTPGKSTKRNECYRCGTSPHHKLSECPARDSTCVWEEWTLGEDVSHKN